MIRQKPRIAGMKKMASSLRNRFIANRPSIPQVRSMRQLHLTFRAGRSLAHDPEKREPAVLLDYFRFILASGHRQSCARVRNPSQ
jgi:hypothetical protein